MKILLSGILTSRSTDDRAKFEAILAIANDLPEPTAQIADPTSTTPRQAMEAKRAFMMVISAIGKLHPDEATVTPGLCFLIADEARRREAHHLTAVLKSVV